MKLTVSSCVLAFLLLFFLFLVINGSAHLYMKEGMKNKDGKEVLVGRKERKAEKMPF